MNKSLLIERNRIIEDLEYLEGIVVNILDTKDKSNVLLEIKRLKRNKDILLKQYRELFLKEMEREEEFRKVKNKVMKKVYSSILNVVIVYSTILLFLHGYSLIKLDGLINVNGINRIEVSKQLLKGFNEGKNYIIYDDIDNKIIGDINKNNYYYEEDKYDFFKIKFIPNFIFEKMNKNFKEYYKYNGNYVNRKTGKRYKKSNTLVEELTNFKIYYNR